MELIDLCKKIIGINSVSVPEGTKELVQFLSPLLEKLGFQIQTQEVLVHGHPNLNLLAKLGPHRNCAELLVNVHLDTVSPGPPKAWNVCGENPFQATIKNDFLYGLGSADTKLAMACLLLGVENVLNHSSKSPSNWRHPLWILGTAGEEHGLIGADHALKENFVKANYVFDSEPSELNIVWAHKGFCMSKIHFYYKKTLEKLTPSSYWKFSFLGEPAHSSTPHLGQNAIHLAIQFLENHLKNNFNSFLPFSLKGGQAPNVIPGRAIMMALGKCDLTNFQKTLPPFVQLEEIKDLTKKPFLSFPLEIFIVLTKFYNEIQNWFQQWKKHTHGSFDPPYTTTSTNIIEVQSKSIPHLVLSQDLRFIEKGEGELFIDRMKTLSEGLMKQYQNIQIDIQLDRLNNPLHGDPHHPFIEKTQKILQNIGLPGELKTKAGCTEGALFSSYGMPTLVIGPGKADNNIHKPNEKVAIKQLKDASRFYAKAIETFCV